MTNITWDRGQLVLPNGIGFQDVGLTLDYGRVSLEIKRLHFQLGRSMLDGNVLIYNPFGAALIKADCSSEYLEPLPEKRRHDCLR